MLFVNKWAKLYLSRSTFYFVTFQHRFIATHLNSSGVTGLSAWNKNAQITTTIFFLNYTPKANTPGRNNQSEHIYSEMVSSSKKSIFDDLL